MPYDQVLIGGTTAAMCLVGLFKTPWILEQTRKGRKLQQWCGEETAPWVLRLLLAAGLGFGVLLATGVINPVRHQATSIPDEP